MTIEATNIFAYGRKLKALNSVTKFLNRQNFSVTKKRLAVWPGSYRYYDQLGLPVQFPFEYGLSYTTFKISAFKLTSNASGSLTVTFDVKNTGSVPGTAVPQIYGVQQAMRSLRGFDRVKP